MNGKLLIIIALVLGAAAAFTKNLKATQARKNIDSNNRLGIYEGMNTTITKHNYLVSIVYKDDLFICAGAIISDSYVLTLGSCSTLYESEDLTVVAGSSDGITGISYPVKNVVFHPNFVEIYQGYDFALLQIEGNFTWGDEIGNVTLPRVDPKGGTPLVAVGYGDNSALGFNGEGTLRMGTMKYVTLDKCQKYYYSYDVIFDNSKACAYDKGKVTMCDNDFGNPFTRKRVLYGLMASGATKDFCSSDAIPVIISDVYSVVNWIKKYI